MKKVILASVSIAAVASMMSGTAHATSQSFCAAPTTAGASSASASAGTGNFIKVAFSPKCSANVHLVGDDLNTVYRVGAVSSKGKNQFGGSTAGGGVSPTGTTCAATGCTASDAAAGYAAAASS